MNSLRVLLSCFALAFAAAAAPASAAAEPVTPAVVERSQATRPSDAEAKVYAEREQQAPAELATFEGGQVVIAISTIGAIVLAAILLILLL
jgi:hypothetical protein